MLIGPVGPFFLIPDPFPHSEAHTCWTAVFLAILVACLKTALPMNLIRNFAKEYRLGTCILCLLVNSEHNIPFGNREGRKQAHTNVLYFVICVYQTVFIVQVLLAWDGDGESLALYNIFMVDNNLRVS